LLREPADGKALVLAPTRELAQQVQKSLESRNRKCKIFHHIFEFWPYPITQGELVKFQQVNGNP
jgi:hypothetical protein